MNSEDFIEEGIVIDSQNGKAEIALISSDNCEECDAKLFCKPKGETTQILEVLDPFGVKPGDEVKISIKGGSVLKATIIMYGIPLLLLFLSILFGMDYFKNTKFPEAYSFLTGLVLMGIYFSLIYISPKLKKLNVNLPKIIFVKTRH